MDIGVEVKHLFDCDVSILREHILTLNEEHWNFNQMRQKVFGFPHVETESIIFIWESKKQLVTTPITLNNLIFDISNKIKNYYSNIATIRTLMLAKLPSNKKIPEHYDGSWLETVHRCHLPIITNKNCKFFINSKNFFFDEGMVFEFNNTMLHSVVNESNIDRIHLVCDIYI